MGSFPPGYVTTRYVEVGLYLTCKISASKAKGESFQSEILHLCFLNDVLVVYSEMACTMSEGIEKKIPVGQIYWIDDKAFLCECEGVRMKQPQSRISTKISRDMTKKKWTRSSEMNIAPVIKQSS